MVETINIINKIQKDVRDLQYRRLHKKTIRNSFIPHSVAIKRSELGKYKPVYNISNISIGLSLIVVGAATFFIPFTTIPLIAFGLLVLLSPVDIRYLIRELKQDIKFKVGLFLQ